jgi:hypothetical protein
VKSKVSSITGDVVAGRTKTGWGAAPTGNCPQG